MKIKCKKCGKHFDPDMYSGLCPKCGTYNGTHAAETDVSRYLDSGESAEETHYQLHERYGDTGHSGDAHYQLHERYGDTGHGEDAHYQLHERYGDTGHSGDAHYQLHERYGDTGHGEDAHQKLHDRYGDAGHAQDAQAYASGADSPRRGRKVPALTVVLAAMLVVIPFLSMGIYQIWEAQAVRRFMNGQIAQVPLADAHTLIFEDELLKAPVEVSVMGMDIIGRAGLNGEDKVLAAVKVQAFSDAYSFDARVNKVVLKYEAFGNTFYQEPVDSYYLEVYLYDLGLSEEDVLSTYNIGNGDMQEGYWFFCIPKEAQELELTVMAGTGSGGHEAFLEGTIPLDDVGTAGLADGEAE